jgi:hypothetical protein
MDSNGGSVKQLPQEILGMQHLLLAQMVLFILALMLETATQKVGTTLMFGDLFQTYKIFSYQITNPTFSQCGIFI